MNAGDITNANDHVDDDHALAPAPVAPPIIYGPALPLPDNFVLSEITTGGAQVYRNIYGQSCGKEG